MAPLGGVLIGHLEPGQAGADDRQPCDELLAIDDALGARLAGSQSQDHAVVRPDQIVSGGLQVVGRALGDDGTRGRLVAVHVLLGQADDGLGAIIRLFDGPVELGLRGDQVAPEGSLREARVDRSRLTANERRRNHRGGFRGEPDQMARGHDQIVGATWTVHDELAQVLPAQIRDVAVRRLGRGFGGPPPPRPPRLLPHRRRPPPGRHRHRPTPVVRLRRAARASRPEAGR